MSALTRRAGRWRLLPSRRRPAATGRRDERGAVAVEAAFVSILLLTISGGIIDVSVYLQASYQVTMASRMAARTASSDPMAAQFGRNAGMQVAGSMKSLAPGRITKIWVYKANVATGQPTSGAACTNQCYKVSLDANGEVYGVSGSWVGRSACSGGTVDPVGVMVEYRNDALFTFLDDSLITNQTVMRLEPLPSTLACVSTS